MMYKIILLLCVVIVGCEPQQVIFDTGDDVAHPRIRMDDWSSELVYYITANTLDDSGGIHGCKNVMASHL